MLKTEKFCRKLKKGRILPFSEVLKGFGGSQKEEKQPGRVQKKPENLFQTFRLNPKPKNGSFIWSRLLQAAAQAPRFVEPLPPCHSFWESLPDPSQQFPVR